MANPKRIHGGLSKQFHSEYVSWREMLKRCYDPETEGWEEYGKRGIKMCRRWKNSFRDFLADMGTKPTPRHTIDRKDNDKGYFKSNCRWATPKEQARNRRTNRNYTHEGRTLCIAAWAEEVGVSKALLYERLQRGMSFADALTSPIMPKSEISHCHVARTFTNNGETKTIAKWCKQLGISYFTVHRRMFVYGWETERAIFHATTRASRVLLQQTMKAWGKNQVFL